MIYLTDKGFELAEAGFSKVFWHRFFKLCPMTEGQYLSVFNLSKNMFRFAVSPLPKSNRRLRLLWES